MIGGKERILQLTPTKLLKRNEWDGGGWLTNLMEKTDDDFIFKNILLSKFVPFYLLQKNIKEEE